jgi:hypothetical protein
MAVVAASALKVTLSPRPFADPDAAARKLMKLANAFKPVQDGRIYIEEDQRAVHLSAQGHACGIQSWPRSCDRQGLVDAA